MDLGNSDITPTGLGSCPRAIYKTTTLIPALCVSQTGDQPGLPSLGNGDREVRLHAEEGQGQSPQGGRAETWTGRDRGPRRLLSAVGFTLCLLRNLYAGQEATVRTGHRTTDWFQIGKGVCQGCILSPCLFNLYAEYIMRNARLDEAQDGIKIVMKNINNLRYDTTLMGEREEELKSLLMKVKEEN